MPDLDLDAIEARCNAATAGPWYAHRSGAPEFRNVTHYIDVKEHPPDEDDLDAPPFIAETNGDRAADAVFLAHAREDVPTLLARVRQLEAELARLRQPPG